MNQFLINKKAKSTGLAKNEYDAIIIGAGIGGLTCGCYLAKAGLKVLIVEQHFKAGGCCTSFKRKGFTFDATTHYIGSFRERGILRKIHDELDLGSKVEIIRFDPSNAVLFPDRKIHIWNDIDKTISELQEHFMDEAGNIERFFKFIWGSDFATLYISLKNRTFKDLLNEYFKNRQLKSMLGIFLVNIGVPPSKASALAIAILYREFVLDGGYYPKGGVQSFPDAFVERFKELGGEILFRKKVEKIIVKDHVARGITVDGDVYMASKKVVSNCDATSTFYELIGKEHLPSEFARKIDDLEISPSAFMVYLGLNSNYSKRFKDTCSWWCSLSNELNMEDVYSELDRRDKPYSDKFIFCAFPSSHDSTLAPENKEIVFLVIPAKYMNNNYWQGKKDYLADELIKKAENYVPGLSSSIMVREIATPLTLERYTSNRNGSAYGWSSTSLQIDKSTMPAETFIQGLYLAGHWATQGTGQGGISTVAYCGMNVAKQIIKSLCFKRK